MKSAVANIFSAALSQYALYFPWYSDPMEMARSAFRVLIENGEVFPFALDKPGVLYVAEEIGNNRFFAAVDVDNVTAEIRAGTKVLAYATSIQKLGNTVVLEAHEKGGRHKVTEFRIKITKIGDDYLISVDTARSESFTADSFTAESLRAYVSPAQTLYPRNNVVVTPTHTTLPSGVFKYSFEKEIESVRKGARSIEEMRVFEVCSGGRVRVENQESVYSISSVQKASELEITQMVNSLASLYASLGIPYVISDRGVERCL